LPKRHAKEFNQKYINENKADYLMLDFIEIGKYPAIELSTTPTPTKPVEPTSAPTIKPTIPVTIEPTTTPSVLELIFGKRKFEFKNGYNFTIKMKKNTTKTIKINDINGYLVPNNFSINTSNDLISAKLDISNNLITITGNDAGKSKLNMVAEFNDLRILGYINVNVEETVTPAPTSYVTSIPTVSPTSKPTSKPTVETT
jgi:hypothetical protein